MALDNTILVRAGNMDEAATILTGTIDIDTTGLADNIQARINDYKAAIFADYPVDYSAAEPGITAMATDILDLVAAATGADVADVLDQIKTMLIAYETANGLTYPCPQCAASSFITVDGAHQFCPLSDGYTQTAVQYVADTSSIKYVTV